MHFIRYSNLCGLCTFPDTFCAFPDTLWTLQARLDEAGTRRSFSYAFLGDNVLCVSIHFICVLEHLYTFWNWGNRFPGHGGTVRAQHCNTFLTRESKNSFRQAWLGKHVSPYIQSQNIHIGLALAHFFVQLNSALNPLSSYVHMGPLGSFPSPAALRQRHHDHTMHCHAARGQPLECYSHCHVANDDMLVDASFSSSSSSCSSSSSPTSWHQSIRAPPCRKSTRCQATSACQAALHQSMHPLPSRFNWAAIA